MRLAGKVALITGASTGIGAALASEFRNRGARLILTSREAPDHEDWVRADLTNPVDRGFLIESALARAGRIDVLVNNAGVALYEPTWQAKEQHIRSLMELNFFTPIELTRHLLPVLKSQQGGAIVNVGSVAGRVPLPWFPFYTASKAALESWTNCLRMELAGSAVQVTMAIPLFVDTAFQAHALSGRPPALASRKVSAADCAAEIANAVEAGRREVFIPGWSRWLGVAHRIAPRIVEQRLHSILTKASR
jgi:short-subunit dehydrogenase